ncbi:MAG TPA: M48 family metalloprotease [Gemmatimonadales bacterium]|nr:M48 family metalloprotease [Gemmatimonadales bacterium]
MTRRSAFIMRSFARPCVAGTLVLGLLSCARNPVTGKSELSLISESQEIQMGQQASKDVAQSIGLYNDAKVQAYVAKLGKQMAAASERPNLPWEFHVVDDASVNAFALPGGFIFVTRGLMASMNNEAELASVLGHEIGHVTHRHSVQQISKAQLAQLGLGIGSILSSDIARFGQLASAGLGILFLKYGRDAELEADRSGFRYALSQNYDVSEMTDVFETLSRISEAGGGGKLPEWLSTHPNPENRIERIESILDTLHQKPGSVVNQQPYLQYISGMTYGIDPRQGYFEGNHFYHPQMKFELTFPEGWQVQNTPQAVAGLSPNQDAIIQLGLAGQASPREAAQQFLSQQGVQAGQASTSSINGLPAASSYFQAQTEQGTIQGIVSFISYGGTTFGLMGYTPAGKLASHEQTFLSTIRSFEELTDRSKLNVSPARVELVKLNNQMSLEEFNNQHPSTITLQELAIINQIEDPGMPLQAGRVVKRVVGGIRSSGS